MTTRISKQVAKRAVTTAAAVLAAIFSGCGEEATRDELLLVFSGDCQAYIEPCG